MRKIDRIVIHCSATGADRPLSAAELDRMHRKRGFNGCGYHYYIRRDGQICTMRPVERVGAHAKGYIFIGIFYISCYFCHYICSVILKMIDNESNIIS